ncbi:hypothetical protein HN031_03210 [Nocardioides sp. zg-1308]|uniref:hypothetical protein n=1 Tax=Nocardioides sp. zg-1308 TaxID=2736253 RepID=UPI0015528266|nr:hypothetical protein [Nocardioides sp. zg-1308]NPD03691.1 hypothetical protein [Nocardioides sp. zg-1308]
MLDRHGIPQTGTFDFYDELLGSTCRDQRFLVFWEGELVASTREQLPPTTPPTTPLREIRRRLAEAKATGATLGWFAYRPDATEEELPG